MRSQSIQDRSAEAMPPERRHLLDVAGYDWSALRTILDAAATIQRAIATPGWRGDELAGRRIATLFYEASTRTRLSFEIAARALGADVVSLDVATSSIGKGESLVDTVRTLRALGVDVVVLRHERSGAPWIVARAFEGSVVNAGDGWHAHPTQALLDLFVLTQRIGATDGSLHGRRIAIVGDLLHSRVARSDLHALIAAGAEVRLSGPENLVEGFDQFTAALSREAKRRDGHAAGSARLVTTLDEALEGVDAAMALRIQRERLDGGEIASLEEYRRHWGLTEERLAAHAAPSAIVMHPGPMNEGIEIDANVADGPRSVVLEQVAAGVAVRAAVLAQAVRGELPPVGGGA